MSFVEVSLSKLVETRATLISSVNSMLEDRHKKFLITFKRGAPQWDLLGLSGIEKLPAVRWKLYNLKQMSSSAHKTAIKKLEKALYG